MSDDTTPLTETEARRLLARAVELDASVGSLVTREQLRSAAIEAGISAAAFDAAAVEAAVDAAPTPAVRGSLRHALRQNLLAGGAFWLFLKVGALVAHAVGGEAPFLTLCLLSATAAGIGTAHRLKARLTRDVLVAVGAGQLVIFAFTLAGVRISQPNVLNWAVLCTGALVAIGTRIRVRRDATPPGGHPLTEPVTMTQWLRRRVARWFASMAAPIARTGRFLVPSYGRSTCRALLSGIRDTLSMITPAGRIVTSGAVADTNGRVAS